MLLLDGRLGRRLFLNGELLRACLERFLQEERLSKDEAVGLEHIEGAPYLRGF